MLSCRFWDLWSRRRQPFPRGYRCRVCRPRACTLQPNMAPAAPVLCACRCSLHLPDRNAPTVWAWRRVSLGTCWHWRARECVCRTCVRVSESLCKRARHVDFGLLAWDGAMLCVNESVLTELVSLLSICRWIPSTSLPSRASRRCWCPALMLRGSISCKLRKYSHSPGRATIHATLMRRDAHL